MRTPEVAAPGARRPAPARRALLHAAPALIVTLAFAATLALFYGGLGPNDSDQYVWNALRWFEQGPTLGRTHWGLRLPLVAPMAASYALFGPSELSSVLPNFLYAAGLVAVTFHFARKHLGAEAGFVAAILVATSTFFIVMPSELTATGPDAFFAALACWLFIDAAASRDWTRYAAAGLSAGGVWLCREVGIFLPFAFALLLLFRAQRDWRAIAAVATGFGAVAATEMIVYGIVAGDPLYRYLVDIGHRGPGETYHVRAFYDSTLGRLWFPLQHLLTDPATTPALALAALVPFSGAFRRFMRDPERRRVAATFGIAALCAFLVSAYGMNLKSPYYYPVVAYASMLTLAAFVASVSIKGRKQFATVAAAALVALSYAAADFRSYGEYDEPRRLARYIAETGEPVMTDNSTAVRTRIFLALDGYSIREAKELAQSTRRREGSLCGLVFAGTPEGSARRIAPEADWTLVWSEEIRKRRWTHRLLASFGAAAAPSPRLAEIVRGAEPAALYRAPCP